MNRNIKTIVTVLVIVLMIGANIATVWGASQSLTPQDNGAIGGESFPGDPGGAPPQDQQGQKDGENGESENDPAGMTPPEGNENTPPDKPEGNAEVSSPDSSENGNEMTPPDGDGSTTPDKPEGDLNGSGGKPQPPEENGQGEPLGEGNANGAPVAPDEENIPQGNPNESGDAATIRAERGDGLPAFWYGLIAAEALILSAAVVILLLTAGHKKTLKESLRTKKKAALMIALILLIAGMIVGAECCLLPCAGGNAAPIEAPGGMNETSSAPEAEGKTVVSDEQSLSGDFSAQGEDESVIVVTDGGALTLNDATLQKSGNSSNRENSDFYGINAGLLAREESSAKIVDTTINTDGEGANAVFACGSDAVIEISDSTITTKGSASARGLDATYGGTINGERLTISTEGNSCAALATDRGEGTVHVLDSKLSTAGSGSPLIYSTGDISIENTTGTATGSQNVVVEGKNSAEVIASELTASGKGNRGDVDQAGVMIYQSMSGDAAEGTGSFKAVDSTLRISEDSEVYDSAPMFFVTNTTAEIDLENTALRFGSDVLLTVVGTEEWGEQGKNGGDVNFYAVGETLAGDIRVDSLSSLIMELRDSSFEGKINAEDTASAVNLVLSEDSTWVLTADSYVTSLEDEDDSYGNIDLNGHTLYVNGSTLVK